MKLGGIFGTTLSGKTTLALELSKHYYRQKKIRSLVLDPLLDYWGEHAWVTANEAEFTRVVFARRGHLVILEDASATVKRDKEFIPFFTKIRHNEHRLLVIGHGGSDLLPVMRKQLDTVYLFQQDVDSVKEWKKIFPRGGVDASLSLDQYEFLRVRSFKTSEKMKLTR